MDYPVFKQQLEAARKGEASVDGITFTMRLPTEYELSVAREATREENGLYNNVRAMRTVLVDAVKGWSGCTTRHILPSAAAEPLDFSPTALADLLDNRQDILAALIAEVMIQRRQRLERHEEEAKN